MSFISPQKWLTLLMMLVSVVSAYAQCAEGQVALSMNIYTDSWPWETYWEIVPGTNACGDGTLIWGGNQSGVGCPGNGDPNGAGDQGYPGNGVVQVTDICLSEIYYQVSAIEAFLANDCEVVYKNSSSQLINQTELNLLTTALDLDKLDYLSLVDGGETEELTEEIIFSTYSDALELYYNLMSKSPALSEQVMIEAIQKEYDLPAVLLTQILASNPTAAKNENVKNAIENRMMPLEEYQKQQIEIGLTLLSSKENIEADLTEMETKRAMLLLAMFDRIESDSSIVNKDDSKSALLNPNKYLNDRFLLINTFIETSKYPSARDMLLSTTDYFKLNGPDMKEIQNLIFIVDLLELNPSTLSVSQINDLESIVANGGAMSSNYAANILVSFSLMEIKSPLYDVEGVNTPRSFISSNNVLALNCQIYPNPTSNILTIDLKDLVATEIRLTDISGRIVLQQLGEWRGQQVLDVAHLANGAYTLTIVTDQERITKEVFKVR